MSEFQKNGPKYQPTSLYRKMNIKFFSFGSMALVAMLLVGCGSPRVKQVNVVNAGSSYTYGQPAEQTLLANSGRQYKKYLKIMQDQRLAHNERMALIDYQAKEVEYAKKKGVALPPQTQSSPQTPQGAAFMPPPGYFQGPPPFVADPRVPQIVLSAPTEPYYRQSYPVYQQSYPSWGNCPPEYSVRRVRVIQSGAGRHW